MYRIADSLSYFNRTNNLLLNPHMGFQTFQRFNGDALYPPETRGWTEGFPIEYQPFTGSLDNGQHPATTVAYHRVYWRYLQPDGPDVYNWELLDKALATAAERKQTLMLRIGPYGHFDASEGCISEKLDVPNWLRTKLGKRQWDPDGEYGLDFLKCYGILDHNNPLYVNAFAACIKAIADRYDNDPRLDSVDIGIVGAWGEEADLDLMTDDNIHTLLHAYFDNFRNTPVLMQTNQSETHDLINNIPRDLNHRNSYLRYAARFKRAIGMRGDCIGDMSYRNRSGEGWRWGHMRSIYPFMFGEEEVRDMWQTGPISFESCGVMYTWLDNGFDIDEILDTAVHWHTSTFSNKGCPVPLEYTDKVNEWLKKIGYRYSLRCINFPGTAAAGDTLQMAMLVSNYGNSPMYRPYPFVLRLLGEGGRTVLYRTRQDIRTWLPGDISFQADMPLPIDLEPGNYILQAGIMDMAMQKGIVNFACDAPATEDGFINVGKITIEA